MAVLAVRSIGSPDRDFHQGARNHREWREVRFSVSMPRANEMRAVDCLLSKINVTRHPMECGDRVLGRLSGAGVLLR
jgi:hypothetical protein